MSAVDAQLVELPSHFLQTQLASLKVIVDQHVQDGLTVQFDACELERIDGAAVQFLLAVNGSQKTALEGRALVVNTNDILTRALKDMGVAEWIATQLSDTENVN